MKRSAPFIAIIILLAFTAVITWRLQHSQAPANADASNAEAARNDVALLLDTVRRAVAADVTMPLIGDVDLAVRPTDQALHTHLFCALTSQPIDPEEFIADQDSGEGADALRADPILVLLADEQWTDVIEHDLLSSDAIKRIIAQLDHPYVIALRYFTPVHRSGKWYVPNRQGDLVLRQASDDSIPDGEPVIEVLTRIFVIDLRIGEIVARMYHNRPAPNVRKAGSPPTDMIAKIYAASKATLLIARHRRVIVTVAKSNGDVLVTLRRGDSICIKPELICRVFRKNELGKPRPVFVHAEELRIGDALELVPPDERVRKRLADEFGENAEFFDGSAIRYRQDNCRLPASYAP